MVISSKFEMKDMDKAIYILGIKIFRNHVKGFWVYLKRHTLKKYYRIIIYMIECHGYPCWKKLQVLVLIYILRHLDHHILTSGYVLLHSVARSNHT